MMETQLRLFPAPQPLVERLGADFFRAVPRSPGVYRMFDAEGRLLYVGKAVDLRQRLSSYRRTHGQSRKTVRLVHLARQIEWEVCPSDAEARLRENALIRSLRPPFNRAGTWPRSARFIHFIPCATGFRWEIGAEPGEESYGAFRAGAGVALLAAARVHWLAQHPSHDLSRLPLPLGGLALTAWDCEVREEAATEWQSAARRFLAGESDELLAVWTGALQPQTPFALAFIARELELLMDFYRRGPVRAKSLRSLLPAGRRTLSPEEHDDLLILQGPAPAPAPRLGDPSEPTAGDQSGSSPSFSTA